MGGDFRRGSEWRKWDLHVHTPASIVQRYGPDNDATWAVFIQQLEELPPDFKVIGINDYLFLEGYERVLAERKKGRLKNLELILPVLEFRLDKFAGVVKRDEDQSFSRTDWNRINIHVIFDELDAELIRQQFVSALKPEYHLIPDSHHMKGRWKAVITRESVADLGRKIIAAAPEEKRAEFGSEMEEGFNNLCVSLDAIRHALASDELAEKSLIAVGKTEWDNMKWQGQSIAEKRNVINQADLVFTASENPKAYDNARKKLAAAKVLDCLLDCSDAHAFAESPDKDRIGNCFTWIKADPTFKGLKQALNEFDGRVFIGDAPPKRELVRRNRTKYISSVSIRKKQGSALGATWFDFQSLPLSTDLVAIVGNKGSGKSALADVIALLGDTKNVDGFSFLNSERFRSPQHNLAGHFIGTIAWGDGTFASRVLSDDPPEDHVERVKYLPQSSLEALCNQLVGDEPTAFDTELKQIIYSHVPPEERLGFDTLEALLEYKVEGLDDERVLLLQQLSRINSEVDGIERKLAPTFKKALDEKLLAKRAELSALEEMKPDPVDNPVESEAAKATTAGLVEKIGRLEDQLSLVEQERERVRAKKAEAVSGVAKARRIAQEIQNYRVRHDQFVENLTRLLADFEGGVVQAKEIVQVAINTGPLDARLAALEGHVIELDGQLSEGAENGIPARLASLVGEIGALRGRLSEPERLFAAYKERREQWEKDRSRIQGDKDKPETIFWYQAQLDELLELPGRRDKLKATRVGLVRKLHAQKLKIMGEYERLYGPVQTFAQKQEQLDSPLPLGFEVRIAQTQFQDTFLSRVNRQTRGTFAGIDESNAAIEKALSETIFNDVESVVAFVERIDDALHFDRRAEAVGTSESAVSEQLRKGNTVAELYDYVYGLGYLVPRYSLTYNGQEISKLSPGERGLLLLVFYLLVDNNDVPLVIDQPEENLDNQTIYKVLVKCIKLAKERRQVIMVTHNPNLAVVCDAEQVICASCDKDSKQFSYESGAIEAAPIRRRVVEVLEGTEPAFLNRKKKYGL